MQEIRVNPLMVFVGMMLVLTALAVSAVVGLQGTRYGVKGVLELWQGDRLMEDNVVYGTINDYEVKHSFTVNVKNPSLEVLSFEFTHTAYPENLSVDVKYSHTMPVRVGAGKDLDFGIQFWVKDDVFDISLTDIWFNMTVVGG